MYFLLKWSWPKLLMAIGVCFVCLSGTFAVLLWIGEVYVENIVELFS